jgi:transposase
MGTPDNNQNKYQYQQFINPLSPELNPICYLLALLAHDFSTLAG